MPILMRIALRNLREHKSKTLIVGILIAVGILILTLGNSVLATAQQGIQKAFIDSFTGHILVRAESPQPVTISGSSGFGADVAGKTVPSYETVFDYLQTVDHVTAVNPQITSFARIDYSIEGQNRFAIAPIFGIEPESYLGMFPDSLIIREGHFLEPGEQGAVLPLRTVEDIRADFGIDLQVGDEMVFQGGSGGGNSGGIKIRRLKLIGVYEYAVDAGNIQPYVFVDAATVRSMSGMVIGTADAVNIDEADTSLLDGGDDMFGSSDDSMFSDDAFFSDDLFSSDSDDLVVGDAAYDEDGLFGILGDTSARTMASSPDAGAWSYILVRLDSLSAMEDTIDEMNAWFDESGIRAEAVDWSEASGGVAQFNEAFQVFFYVVVVILAVVAVIIIMNTLLISVIERTGEIGTMRSLGAQKPVVRRMFIAETMSISLVFGTLGLVIGLGLITIFNAVGIAAPNTFFELLFGGSVLRPVIDPWSILHSYLIMLGIGVLSSWYPVRVALKVTPLEAMQAV